MQFLPRFQGNALEDENGWYWEMFVSEFGGGQDTEMFSTTERFKTKEDALKNLHSAIQSSIDHIANLHPELGIDKGCMIDLKTNQKMYRDKQKIN